MTFEQILALLPDARKSGKGWSACCPAHDDRNASLSIAKGDNGNTLLHCHAMCPLQAVVAAMGITKADLNNGARPAAVRGNIVATYDYVDEDGKLLYQAVRYDPKDFRQRRPDGRGGWIWNLTGVRRVLFQLPQVLAAPFVLVVDGEKDVLTARDTLELVATCNAMGCGKWNAEYSDSLRGKIVCVIADADTPGRAHAQAVAASLFGKAASLKVLELPGGGKDLTDWVEAGGTREPLNALIGNAPEWTAAPVAEVMPVAEPATLARVDMPDAVLDGRLGEMCQRRLLSLSPLAYAWPALLAAAGTLANQNGKLRANLFIALVGDVGTGKSATISNALTTFGLDENSPEISQSMAGSAEGLLKNIGDANGLARLYNPDELAHLFAKAAIERASFAFVLQRAYYNTAFELIITKGKRVAVNVSLGVVGGIVEKKFGECFNSATTAGLYDRFIFGLCPQPFQYDYRPFERGPETLNPPRAVTVTRDVWALKTEWMKTIPGMTGRTAENALRVAAICAGWDGRSELLAAHLGPALEFAKYQIRVRELLQPNPGENPDAVCAFAILRKMEQMAPGGEWLAKRQISKAIHSERFGPGIFRRAGDNLVFNGEIERNLAGPDRNKVEYWKRI